MSEQKTFLVFGATGQTGKHFTALALAEGHRVKALVRNPSKLEFEHPDLEVHVGAITDELNLDELLQSADFVVAMLGDAELQKYRKINTEFVRNLIAAMRRQHVTRFLYQAGGLSKPPDRRLSPALWAIRKTLARGYNGQHQDNEAVMRYLTDEAQDIEWMVHRAAIRPNGASKGVLVRSASRPSMATFEECAAYNVRTVVDASAIHTCDLSRYQKG